MKHPVTENFGSDYVTHSVQCDMFIILKPTICACANC